MNPYVLDFNHPARSLFKLDFASSPDIYQLHVLREHLRDCHILSLFRGRSHSLRFHGNGSCLSFRGC